MRQIKIKLRRIDGNGTKRVKRRFNEKNQKFKHRKTSEGRRYNSALANKRNKETKHDFKILQKAKKSGLVRMDSKSYGNLYWIRPS